MRKIVSVFILWAFLAGLCSCVKDIILDAKEKPHVVVVCILTDDPEQLLRLSFTKGASLKEAPLLTEATAVLFEGDVKIGEFQHKEGNEWTLSYSAVPGHSYRLEVEVPGYDKIWAEQTMPEHVSFYCNFYNRYDDVVWPWSDDGYGVTPQWPEDEEYPPYETLYYLPHTAFPVWLCGMNYNPETEQWEVASEIGTNAHIPVDRFNLTGNEYVPPSLDIPNPYRMNPGYDRIRHIAEQFQNAHLLELYPDIAGEPLHDGFLRFGPFEIPDSSVNSSFFISGSFSGEYYDIKVEPGSDWYFTFYYHLAGQDGLDRFGERMINIGCKGYILCTVPSADYDRFLVESYHYRQIWKSTDLTTIYLRDNVPSNIRGSGIGLFGAAVRRIYPWTPTYTYADAGLPTNNVK